MVFIGMIFQYNTQNCSGLLMLSDGTQKEFTDREWIDTDTPPAVGQKIAYTNDASGVTIKIASDDDMKKASLKEENTTSVEGSIKEFASLGYKLVKESTKNEIRTVIMRSFASGESEEIVIKEEASKVSIVKTINGKRVEG